MSDSTASGSTDGTTGSTSGSTSVSTAGTVGSTAGTAGEELRRFSADVVADVRAYLTTLDAVASGGAGSQAVALLLLDVARICVAGARLGATTDVILDSNVEPDVGGTPDADALRAGLAEQLGPADAYAEVFDPYDDDPPVSYRLSDDLADIAGALVHGLRHFDAGRPLEALWWWQFTYLNHWGNHAGAALRALQSVVAHARLDTTPEETPRELDETADPTTA